jgi:hypothetical protein
MKNYKDEICVEHQELLSLNVLMSEFLEYDEIEDIKYLDLYKKRKEKLIISKEYSTQQFDLFMFYRRVTSINFDHKEI